ncbi:MAG: hypothetical protein V4537_03430 [Pseudomonadota bacterium]
MTIFANETTESVNDALHRVVPMAASQRPAVVAAFDRGEAVHHSMVLVSVGDTFVTASPDLTPVDLDMIKKYTAGTTVTGWIIAEVGPDLSLPMTFGIATRRNRRLVLNYGYVLAVLPGQDGVFMASDEHLPCYRLIGGRLTEVDRPIVPCPN